MLLDDIFARIGDRGRYQVGLYLIIMLVALPAAWNHMGITFLGAEMDHWCLVPELTNLSYEEQKLIASPLEKSGRYSKCEMFDLDYANFTPEVLKNWSRVANDTPTVPCRSGWVFDQSVFVSTAMSQWDLVCDDYYLLAMIQTVYMGGVLVGCLFFGQVSDRVGRLKALFLSCLLWVIAALIAALVPYYVVFVIFRFFVGACAAGAYTTVFVMSMEMMGPAFRMETGIFVQGWFALGIMTFTGMAYCVRDFVHLQLITGITPVLFLTYYWFIPESPRWLIANYRDGEAEKVLKLMARLNRSEVPKRMHLEENRQESTKEKAMLFDLFKTPNLRWTTTFMWIAWLSASLVYYGLSLGVSLLEGSLFFNTFLTGLVEIPAYFFTVLALKYVGRRWSTVATFFGTGLFCIIATPFIGQEGKEALVITMMMLGKAFGSASFAILYVYAAELFPTLLRNVGVGSSSMMARLGGLIQPQIALLSVFWFPLPFILYGVFGVVGGLVSLYFPETLGQYLPETLHEAEHFRTSKRRLSAVMAERRQMVHKDSV